MGVALGAVRGAGAARDRRRGMIVAAVWSRAGKSGSGQVRRIATASDSPPSVSVAQGRDVQACGTKAVVR